MIKLSKTVIVCLVALAMVFIVGYAGLDASAAEAGTENFIMTAPNKMYAGGPIITKMQIGPLTEDYSSMQFNFVTSLLDTGVMQVYVTDQAGNTDAVPYTVESTVEGSLHTIKVEGNFTKGQYVTVNLISYMPMIDATYTMAGEVTNGMGEVISAPTSVNRLIKMQARY